jgi:hypothetical protein
MLLKTLKQMSRILEDGHKIAVYSHNQNGKIRLLMAAWEIYYNNIPAKRAIQKARQIATLTHGKPGMNYWTKWYTCWIKPKKYRYYAFAEEKEGVLFSLEKGIIFTFILIIYLFKNSEKLGRSSNQPPSLSSKIIFSVKRRSFLSLMVQMLSLYPSLYSHVSKEWKI